MTTGEITTLLKARGFHFTHSLGQNFLVDEEILNRIVCQAGVSGRNVLEIGAGAGCLTSVLAQNAGRVLAIEIDKNLIPVLETVLQPYRNVKLIHGDVLKLDLLQETQSFFVNEPYDIVANLPYYITTPVLFQLLDSKLPLEHICVMLQKEAVQRVLAKPGDKEYGPLAVICAYRANAERLFTVPPESFIPQPHVESEVIQLTLKSPSTEMENVNFERFVKSCFAMRRKTLVNNLIGIGLSREEAQNRIECAGLQSTVRAETLTVEEFIELYKIIQK